MRVVLDTNILVSGLLWKGTPYRCLLAVQAGLAELALSPPILHELRTVLIEKLGQSPPEADEAVRLLGAMAKIVEIPGSLRSVPEDPEDDKFVETACVAKADCIVSGDHHLIDLGVAAGIPIITARMFLERLGGAAT